MHTICPMLPFIGIKLKTAPPNRRINVPSPPARQGKCSSDVNAERKKKRRHSVKECRLSFESSLDWSMSKRTVIAGRYTPQRSKETSTSRFRPPITVIRILVLQVHHAIPSRHSWQELRVRPHRDNYRWEPRTKHDRSIRRQHTSSAQYHL